MPARSQIEPLTECLFAEPELAVYAILDGASVPGLRKMLWKEKPEHVCLYRGDLEPDLAAAAPYLIKLERGSSITEWILDEGWGNHWGIFALVPNDVQFRDVRKHFRGFLMVEDPDGKPVYFRFYDPRVLRVYLPTCNEHECRIVFGPVSSYAMESESGDQILRYSPDAPSPAERKVPLRVGAGA